MTETYFPFTSGSGTQVDDSRWSMMARNWVPTGVIKGALNELAVSAAGTAMQVTVDAGRASILGEMYQNDSIAQLPVAAADATNPRIDVVAVRVDWAAETVSLVVLEGTPAASPSAPALTQNDILNGGTRWEIALAHVAVAANATTIGASDVTDERAFTGTITDAASSFFPSQLSENGYQKLPSGLITQWGTFSGLSNGQVVNFPITFPNACFAVDLTWHGNGGYSNPLAYNYETPSGFTVYDVSGGSGLLGSFIATGY